MVLGQDVLQSLIREGLIEVIGKDGLLLDITELTINQHSINVTCGHSWAQPYLAHNHSYLDPYNPDSVRWEEWDEPNLIIRPQQFILGVVNERIVFNDSVDQMTRQRVLDGLYFHQMYDGRSTVGRLGITSHCTAGYGDYGFDGNFTTEIINHLPFDFMLRDEMEIGQITLGAVAFNSQPIKYSGAYSLQRNKPKIPVIGRDRFTRKKP